MSALNELQSVVAFGGGTGLGRLLSALSFLEQRLTGIVTTTDDGGSTGRLRRATGAIAWGDLRNCFSQICTEPTLGRLLFEYRFADSGELTGHNLGNLMLLALDQLTARPLDAVDLVRGFLEIKPRLLPMSEEPTTLEAEDEQGARVSGETSVDHMASPPRRLWLSPQVEPPPEVPEAIAGAELILMGPGSFATSVLPSLLVEPIRAAVCAASCPRVLVANLQQESGPLGRLNLGQQLEWMEQVLGAQLVDAVLWPRSRPLEGDPAIPVQVAELADGPHRHHRDKLVTALARMLPRVGRGGT